MGFLWLLIALMLTPVVLVIAGIAMLFYNDEAKRKRGRNLLLVGIVLLLVEILIGYSVCSDLNFH